MLSHRSYIVLFFVAVFLVGPVGQFFVFRSETIYKQVLKTRTYDDAYWVTGKPRIVIMGSSHAKHVIIPNVISEENPEYDIKDIVNIGDNAASAFEMYTSFNKNLDKFSNVEIVYYTLEPHMLTEKYYLHEDYEKIFINRDQWDYLASERGITNSYYFPLSILMNAIRFTDPPRSKKYNGFIPLKAEKFSGFKPNQVNKKFFAPIELFPVSEYQLRHLKLLKDQVERSGAQFIFVLTPTYSWNKFYGTEASEFDSILVDRLNVVFGKVVIVGSFRREEYQLEYGDFKDDTHLAHQGAEKFTRKEFRSVKTHVTKTPEVVNPLYSY